MRRKRHTSIHWKTWITIWRWRSRWRSRRCLNVLLIVTQTEAVDSSSLSSCFIGWLVPPLASLSWSTNKYVILLQLSTSNWKMLSMTSHGVIKSLRSTYKYNQKFHSLHADLVCCWKPGQRISNTLMSVNGETGSSGVWGGTARLFGR